MLWNSSQHYLPRQPGSASAWARGGDDSEFRTIAQRWRAERDSILAAVHGSELYQCSPYAMVADEFGPEAAAAAEVLSLWPLGQVHISPLQPVVLAFVLDPVTPFRIVGPLLEKLSELRDHDIVESLPGFGPLSPHERLRLGRKFMDKLFEWARRQEPLSVGEFAPEINRMLRVKVDSGRLGSDGIRGDRNGPARF